MEEFKRFKMKKESSLVSVADKLDGVQGNPGMNISCCSAFNAQLRVWSDGIDTEWKTNAVNAQNMKKKVFFLPVIRTGYGEQYLFCYYDIDTVKLSFWTK